MKARIFALLAIAVPSLAPSQDTAKQITFSAKAQDAGKMLAELSKFAGTALIADGPVRQEILLLDVKEVSLKDLLERIARVAGAEWVKKHDGLHLTRTGALMRKQAQEEISRRSDLIRKEIAFFKKDAERSEWTPNSAATLARQLLAAGREAEEDPLKGMDAQPCSIEELPQGACLPD